MLALATASLSFNVAVRPSLAVSRVAQPKMGLVADIKDAVLPSNTDSTLRNVMGYQMTGWGVGATVCPALMMNTLFAANPTGATVWMMRAMGLGMLSLGAKTCGGSDADAATTGLIFYGAWYKVLTAAAVVSGTGKAAAATLGGYVTMIATWNLLCALSCARRSGGLFKTLTTLDMGPLDAVLPKDTKLSTRNIVGMSVSFWGVLGLFFQASARPPFCLPPGPSARPARPLRPPAPPLVPPHRSRSLVPPTASSQDFFFGAKLLNVASTPLLAMSATGIAIANLLLGGKIMAGSDSDAATDGAVLFTGYFLISYLATAAGVFSGAWMSFLPYVNLATAAYCLKEKL